MGKMRTAVLFDMDGVIIDSEGLYEKVQKIGLEHYNINLKQEDYLRFKGLSEAAVFDLLERDYNVQWDRPAVIAESHRLMLAEFRENLKYMGGFPEIIARFDKQYLLGLVTSTGRDFLNQIDQILAVRKFFTKIVAGGDTIKTKPDPEPYMQIMKLLQVEPANAVVIEDSVNGVRSGKAAGAQVIGLSATYSGNDLSEADICVKSLDEIDVELINSLVDAAH